MSTYNRSAWLKLNKDKYTCELCKFSTPMRSNYILHCSRVKHFRNVDGIVPETVYECKVCEYTASTNGSLKKHRASIKHTKAVKKADPSYNHPNKFIKKKVYE